MHQLDQRMDELMAETKGWPQADRVAYIQAEMDNLYTKIQAENRAAEISAHEAKFGRDCGKRTQPAN